VAQVLQGMLGGESSMWDGKWIIIIGKEERWMGGRCSVYRHLVLMK
jgi:hypothetical protein